MNQAMVMETWKAAGDGGALACCGSERLGSKQNTVKRKAGVNEDFLKGWERLEEKANVGEERS